MFNDSMIYIVQGPKQHWMVADEDPEDETEIA